MENQLSAHKTNIGWQWILFLVWPFAGFMYAIQNFKNPAFRMFIVLFIAFYGFTMVMVSDQLDSYRHAQTFIITAQKPFSEFFNILRDVFSRSSGTLDIYVPLSGFLISRFTVNPAWFFGFHAFVFGLFYLKSLQKLYDEFTIDHDINSRFFFAFIVFWITVNDINSIRMWTACWVYFYGVYHVLKGEKMRYYTLIAASSMLIHFSFFLFVAILLVYRLLGDRNKLYYAVLAASYILPGLFTNYMASLDTNTLGQGLEQRVESYSNQDITFLRTQKADAANWYVRWRSTLVNYYIRFALVFVYIQHRIKNNLLVDQTQRNIFYFCILLLSFSNFTQSVASLGGRSNIIFILFSLTFFYRLYRLNPRKKSRTLIIIGAIPFLLYVIVKLRLIADFFNVSLLVGNPVIFLFGDIKMPFIDLIK